MLKKHRYMTILIVGIIAMTFVSIKRLHIEQKEKNINDISKIITEKNEIPAKKIIVQKSSTQSTDIKKTIPEIFQNRDNQSKLELPLPESPLDKLMEGVLLDGDLIEVLDGLSTLPSDTLLEAFLKYYGSPFANIRNTTLKIANFFSSIAYLPLYEKGLQDTDAKVRCTAIRCMINLGCIPVEVTEQLKKMLKYDSDKTVKRVVVDYFLGQDAESLNNTLMDDDTMLELYNLMIDKSSIDPQCPIYASWILCRTSKNNNIIKAHLKEIYKNGCNGQGDDLAIALAAGGALLKRNEDDINIKRLLFNNINNENEYIRTSSILGLTTYATEADVKDAIIKLIPNESCPRVMKAIGEFGSASKDKEFIGAFCKKYDETGNSVVYEAPRIEVAAALAKLGVKDGFYKLVEIIDNDNYIPPGRLVALGQLRTITKHYFECIPYGSPNQRATAIKEIQTYIEENYHD